MVERSENAGRGSRSCHHTQVAAQGHPQAPEDAGRAIDRHGYRQRRKERARWVGHQHPARRLRPSKHADKDVNEYRPDQQGQHDQVTEHRRPRCAPQPGGRENARYAQRHRHGHQDDERLDHIARRDAAKDKDQADHGHGGKDEQKDVAQGRDQLAPQNAGRTKRRRQQYLVGQLFPLAADGP